MRIKYKELGQCKIRRLDLGYKTGYEQRLCCKKSQRAECRRVSGSRTGVAECPTERKQSV